MTSVLDSGDREWLHAGQRLVQELAKEVGEQAKAIDKVGSADAIHDMRTATRRLRTAVEIYGSEAPKRKRKSVEAELKRVARRLGAVRDLDILLVTLEDGDKDRLTTLRTSWRGEREAGAKRLIQETHQPRFADAVRDSESLIRAGEPPIGTVATQAPSLIWDRFGRVVAHDIDPSTDSPERIHQVRIAAKKLRYTLEAFEDAIEPGTTLIVQVTAFQDAAGDMHDAIVAAQRARAMAREDHLSQGERNAIDAFADGQAKRADGLRPQISRTWTTLRGRQFREALGRAVADMGHIAE